MDAFKECFQLYTRQLEFDINTVNPRSFYIALCALGLWTLSGVSATAGTTWIQPDAAYLSALRPISETQTHHNFHTAVPDNFAVLLNRDLDGDTPGNAPCKHAALTRVSIPKNLQVPRILTARYLFAKAVSPRRYILFSSYLI